MSSVFDRINDKVSDQPGEEGISPMALAKLPQVQRQLMRLLLRELEMTQAEIAEAMAELPDDKRPEMRDVDAALIDLSKEGWVIRMGEGDVVSYRANLRRKAPSTLAKSIWSALDARIEERKAARGGASSE